MPWVREGGDGFGVSAQDVASAEPEEFPAWRAGEGTEHGDVGDAWRYQAVMACFTPEQAFYGRGLTRNGKRELVFPRTEAGQVRAAIVSEGEVLDLPCGKCEGCLLERAQEWAGRCEQEASLWRNNVFVTLTYAPEFLPVVGGVATLSRRDFQLFMKRLRRDRRGVRFIVAGEYGKLGRPHYHALLFNCAFPDRVILQGKDVRRPGSHALYRSAELEGLWPLGYSSLGEVTFESAAYVARYTLKKAGAVVAEGSSGDRSADGKGVVREAEWMSMSLKPGIGAGWFEKYKREVFPLDEVVTKAGRRFRPPRYYSVLFEREDPEGFARVKAKRESRPDADSYAVVVGGKLHTRLGARRELAVRRIRDYLKREV